MDGILTCRLNLCFATVLLLCAVVSCLGGDGQSIVDKLAKLDAKMDAIDQKVDAVDRKLESIVGYGSEAHSLIASIDNTADNIDSNLDNIDSNLDRLPTTKGEETGPETVSEESGPLQVISVERRSLNSSTNTFSVRLRTSESAEGLLSDIHESSGHVKSPHSITNEGSGLWTVNFTLGNSASIPDNYWRGMVIIADQNYDHMIALMVNNSLNSPPEHQELPALHKLHVSPPRELVYVRGENASVTGYVTVGNAGSVSEYGASIWEIFSGVDLDTTKYWLNFDQDGFIDATVRPNSASETEDKLITIQTSTRPVSGYLVLMTDQPIQNASIVNSVQVMRTIKVHPDNQAGPLPPGYLAFAEDMYYEKSEDGNDLVTCSVDHACEGSCYAVGENIESIDVVKVLDNDVEAVVLDSYRSPAGLGDFQSIQWSIDLRPDVQRFRCIVWNGGQQVTRQVDAMTVSDARILEDESRVLIYIDENDPDIRVVSLQCVIAGKPLPEITFSWEPEMVHDVLPDSTTPIVLGGNRAAIDQQALAVKNVTLQANQLEELLQSLSREPYNEFYWSPRCRVESPESHISANYMLQLP